MEDVLRTRGPSGTKKRRTTSNGNSSPLVTKARLKAALQSLLTELEIEHYNLVRGKKHPADNLIAVHAVHRIPVLLCPF
jgi:glutathione S-transferase